MRRAIAIAVILAACGKSGEEAGREAALKQAEAEQKMKEGPAVAAKRIDPPVTGRQMLSCDAVIDAAKWKDVLGEPEPVTVKTAKEPDAAASCSIVRGGKRPNAAEQAALKKQNGRLGVMPGDEICNVSTFCWTIEDPER